MGGLALEPERELARELVRRSRRLERLQEVLRLLLAAGEGIAGQAGAERRGEAWQVAAAMAEQVLQVGPVGAAGRR